MSDYRLVFQAGFGSIQQCMRTQLHDIQHSIEPEVTLIPAGEFRMGRDCGMASERPVHLVALDGFGAGVCCVTNRQYGLFTNDTHRQPPPSSKDERFNHPDQPVTSVNWFDAVEYCEWLSAKSGKRYRLPTEAEWEMAARGGRNGALYTWGDDPPEQQPGYAGLWSTGPERVGSRPPNGFGLFDMSENVHEWCSDWFDPRYYEKSPARNPGGPSSGTRRSSRGGSWRHQIKITRVAARSSIPPEFRYSDYGFRVAMDLQPRR